MLTDRASRLLAATPEQCAYAAGLFDAGGYMVISEPKRKGQSWAYRIQMRMNSKRALLAIQVQWGGALYRTVRKNAPTHWKSPWNLDMAGYTAAEFFRAIEPYVVAKAAQVKLAILFAKTVPRRRVGRSLPPEHVQIRRQVIARIKEGSIAG